MALVASGLATGVAAAAAPGAIKGRVTDATGAPVAGICVTASTGAGETVSPPTGSDGRYRLDLAAGSYLVRFYDCAGTRFATEIYDDVVFDLDRTLVRVQAGATTSGISASLTAAASISGRLTDEGGSPIEVDPDVLGQCQVTAWLMISYTSGAVGLGYSARYNLAGPGTFTIERLPPGDYRVWVTGCPRHFSESWDDRPIGPLLDATPVAVELGATVDNVDFALAAKPSLQVAQPRAWEGDDATRTVTVPVRLDAPTTRDIMVRYSTRVCSCLSPASEGSDFVPAFGWVLVTAGSVVANVNISIVGDAEPEAPKEYFYVEISSDPAARGGGQARVTIRDDDPPAPEAALRTSSLSVDEPVGHDVSVPVTVTLSSAVAHPVSVRYRLVGGSAQVGEDFAAASGTIVLAPGERQRRINVTILPDDRAEPAEFLLVELVHPSGATIAGGPGRVDLHSNAS